MDYGDETSLRDTAPLPGLTARMLKRGTHTARPPGVRGRARPAQGVAGFHRQRRHAGRRGPDGRREPARRAALMHEALTAPAFKPEEFEQVRARAPHAARAGPHRSRRRSRGARSRGEGNPYPPGDVRYVPTDRRGARAARPQRPSTPSKAFHDTVLRRQSRRARHRRRLRRGRRSSRCVAEPVRRLRAPPRRTRACPIRTSPRSAAERTFETPDKPNATMLAKLAVPINDLSPDFAPLLVANRILGGDADSRLFERIRVKEGLSYGVGTQISPGAHRHQHASCCSTRSSRRRTCPKVKSAFDEELARARRDRLHDARDRQPRASRCSRSGASPAPTTVTSPASSSRRTTSAARGRMRAKQDAAIGAATARRGERGAAQVRDAGRDGARVRRRFQGGQALTHRRRTTTVSLDAQHLRIGTLPAPHHATCVSGAFRPRNV